MTYLNRGKQRISSFRKPWNISALVMAIVAISLMFITVFSIQINPRKTGDYLQNTGNGLDSAVQKDKAHIAVLEREIVPASKARNGASAGVPAKPMKVKVGMYATNNFNINPQVPSFDSTGYIWFKWGDDLQEYLTKNDLKIWKVMTPINLLDIPGSAESVFTPTTGDEPIKMKDGSWYLTGAYKGTFYIDRTDFHYHPFTKLNLPIMIEADDILLSYNTLQIEPDRGGSGVGQFIDATNGWVNIGWALNSYKHHYDTDFGFGEGASDYSQLIYDVGYSTSTWLAFWKILIPITIVMAMVVGATKLDPVHYDVRLTMPVTVLLTLVFLQQGFNSDLPRLSYMTFLDEVFVVCYILTVAAFVLMLWACRRYYNAQQIEDPAIQERELRRLDKSDDYWPTYVIGAGIISIAICWITG